MQINLAHTRAAADNLSRVAFDLKPDIILIQEPYYSNNNKIIGCSMNDIVIAADTQPLCAVVIRNNSVTVFPIKVDRDKIIVKIENRNTKIVIICLYSSPSINFTEFLFTLNELISNISHEYVIIGGDFNAKSSIWGGENTDQRGEELIEFMLNNNLNTLNNNTSLPTFETINGKSWVDITLASINLLSEVVFWKVLETESLSDHRYIFFSLFHEKIKPVKRLTKKGEILLLNRLKEDRWLKQTGLSPINSLFQLKVIISIFYHKFNAYRKKYMRNVKAKHKPHPWWNAELEIMRKKVRALRRRYQRCKNATLRTTFKKAYYDFLQEYKDEISKAKESSWQCFCTENTKQNVFGVPYKIAFEKIKTPLIIPPIQKGDGTLTTSTMESLTLIINCLFQKDNSEIDTPEQDVIRSNIMLDTNSPDDLYFTEVEIQEIIKKLKPRSAPGLDNITSNIMKSIFYSHPGFIINILNNTLKFHYFPIEWKRAKLILLNKPNKPIDKPRSYRPICLNSIFGKILERLLNSRLYYFLYNNNLFHPNQYGFTHNTSAVNALYQIKNTILEQKDSDNHSILISLDFQGAFDSLWYPFVLKYLRDHNCPSNLYSLLKSFFENRTLSYISAAGEIHHPVELGCPQGSPLSPLLWNILISDLLSLDLPPLTYMQAYADDTIVIVSGKNRRNIETTANESLLKITKWASDHRLHLNLSKCQCIMFVSGRRLSQARPPTIRINNTSLKFVPTLRMLGVTIDCNLTFLPHVEFLREKVLKHTLNLTSFSKLQWGINQKQQRELYLRCIERYMVYGASVWWKSSNNSHLLRKITSLQRIPLLHIARAYRTSSNVSLPVLCNVIPIHITLDKELKQFRLFQQNKEISSNNVIFNRNNTDYFFDPWYTHPASKYKIEFKLNTTVPSHFHIYTDGSLTPSKVGAAFVVMLPSMEIEHISQFKLPGHATIYDAERIAFEQALYYIKNNKNSPAIITIYTDSLSLLQNLANVNTKTTSISQVKQLIMEIESMHRLHLVYVKAHVGNMGNELADHYAKQAHLSDNLVQCPYSKQYVKKQLAHETTQLWDMEWNEMGRDKELFTWISTIHDIPDLFPPSNLFSQILTGHGKFPFYLYRFNITSNSNCFCGMIATSFEHYFTTCPCTIFFRNKLNQLKLHNFDTRTKSAILKNTKALEILERMMTFIQDEMNMQ